MPDVIPKSKIHYSRRITDAHKPREDYFEITLESQDEVLDEVIKKAKQFIDIEEAKLK